jgi:hypothetical protein
MQANFFHLATQAPSFRGENGTDIFLIVFDTEYA